MTHLAKKMRDEHGIPFLKVSFFGLEDMSAALYDTAKHFDEPALLDRTQGDRAHRGRAGLSGAAPLQGKTYRQEGGNLRRRCVSRRSRSVRALRTLGMTTAIVGTQTGDKDDLFPTARDVRRRHRDRRRFESARTRQILPEKDVDLFIGGVKERPIAYKLGIGFCDHNHERKEALAGYVGMLNFAPRGPRELLLSRLQYMPRRASALMMNAECRMQNGETEAVS